MLDALPDPIWLVDLVLAVVILEFTAVGLFAWRRRAAPLGLLANLGAGATLLLTARAALMGDKLLFVLMLCAAGLAHSFDLFCRWRATGGLS